MLVLKQILTIKLMLLNAMFLVHICILNWIICCPVNILCQPCLHALAIHFVITFLSQNLQSVTECINACTHAHAHAHTRMHAHTHACMHTHTHTHISILK